MRKRRVRWLTVVGASALLSSACSLALGIDRDEYTRGSSVTTLDGGGDRTAAVLDGSGGGERGPSAQSPCGASHRICDDFDAPTTLADRGWESPFITGASTLVVDDVDSISRPKSLSIVGAPNGTCSINRRVPGLVPQGDLDLAFDFRLGDPGPGVALAQLLVGRYQVRMLVLADHSITFDEWDENTGRLTARRPSNAVLNSGWNHVELLLRFIPNKQAGSRVVLRVNGTAVIDDAATPSVDTGAVAFDIGEIDRPNEAVSARFDNVTFDAP